MIDWETKIGFMVSRLVERSISVTFRNEAIEVIEATEVVEVIEAAEVPEV